MLIGLMSWMDRFCCESRIKAPANADSVAPALGLQGFAAAPRDRPRFRALALFGHRSPKRVVDLGIPASESLHRKRRAIAGYGSLCDDIDNTHSTHVTVEGPSIVSDVCGTSCLIGNAPPKSGSFRSGELERPSGDALIDEVTSGSGPRPRDLRNRCGRRERA
jgi:hypothetical protein